MTSHPIQLSLPRLDPETHAGMEGDRACVDRRGDTAHQAVLTLAHGGEEALVQLTAEAAFAALRVHADEVNVSFLGSALRKKPIRKAAIRPSSSMIKLVSQKCSKNKRSNMSLIFRPPHHSSSTEMMAG